MLGTEGQVFRRKLPLLLFFFFFNLFFFFITWRLITLHAFILSQGCLKLSPRQQCPWPGFECVSVCVRACGCTLGVGSFAAGSPSPWQTVLSWNA